MGAGPDPEVSTGLKTSSERWFLPATCIGSLNGQNDLSSVCRTSNSVGCSKSEVGPASEFGPDGVGSSGFPMLEKTAPISPDVLVGKRRRVLQRPGQFGTSHEATAYW